MLYMVVVSCSMHNLYFIIQRCVSTVFTLRKFCSFHVNTDCLCQYAILVLVTWVSYLVIGQRLWPNFLRVALLITNSRIHAGCIICLSLCIGWCLHRILDEKEQWQLILAEYSIIHVSFLFGTGPLFLLTWDEYNYSIWTSLAHWWQLHIRNSHSFIWDNGRS